MRLERVAGAGSARRFGERLEEPPDETSPALEVSRS
jgi:hypothetical protein